MMIFDLAGITVSFFVLASFSGSSEKAYRRFSTSCFGSWVVGSLHSTGHLHAAQNLSTLLMVTYLVSCCQPSITQPSVNGGLLSLMMTVASFLFLPCFIPKHWTLNSTCHRCTELNVAPMHSFIHMIWKSFNLSWTDMDFVNSNNDISWYIYNFWMINNDY